MRKTKMANKSEAHGLLPEMFDELDEEELRENETEEKLSRLNFDDVQKQDAKHDAKTRKGRKSMSQTRPETTASDANDANDPIDPENADGETDVRSAAKELVPSESEATWNPPAGDKSADERRRAGFESVGPKSRLKWKSRFEPESVDMSADERRRIRVRGEVC